MTGEHGRLPWLILEMRTGALDGWYRQEADARGVLAHLRQRHPAGEWVLLQCHDGGGRIPQERFWLNRLGEGEPCDTAA